MFSEETDDLRPFIEEKMRDFDSTVYTQEEFDIFFSLPHKVITYRKEERLLAFCTLSIEKDLNKMCYTWCEKSKEGKQAYATGINYILENYSPIGFAKGASKFNKIKRMING